MFRSNSCAGNILIESVILEVINQKANEIVNEMPKQNLDENDFLKVPDLLFLSSFT
jgi:hypothetical protein